MTDPKKKWDDLRNKVIGLGEQSSRKSYYPELQKRLEELKASQEDLLTVFDSTHDAIFIHDNLGAVLDVNKSMIQMYGLRTKEEALQYNISEYTDLNTSPQQITAIWDMLKENPDNVVFDWKARKPLTNEVFDVEVALRPVKWKNKELIVAAVRDIAFRKKAEKEKNDLIESVLKAKAEAEQANTAKTEFLANISHEIRTPMNTILGLVEVLSEYPLQKEQHDLIETIKRSGHLLIEIINNVLDLSKIEAGVFEVAHENFDLRNNIEGLIKIFQFKAESKGLYLNMDIAPDVPNELVGDIVHIKQVIFNLLANSIKFTSTGGIKFSVTLESELNAEQKSEICFTVEDTGVGIPADKLHKIFERFHQADGSIQRKYGGTGLGLSIARELVHLMKGTINVDSQLGRGATFKFNIPFERSSPTVQVAHALEKDSSKLFDKLKGKRILIVDDAEENRQLINLYMRKTGIIIEEAVNGEEACAKFIQNDYDLVLMDISMPVMDGYTAVKLMRQHELDLNRRATPIIACTAFALSEERERSLASGCNAHLAKPISKVTLLQTIATYL